MIDIVVNSSIENLYVKETYEKIASHFDVTRVYTWKWIEDFLQSLNVNSMIYDIGCGNGRNMIPIKNHTFIGVDNCEKFVEICLKNKKLAICCEMTNINLPENSADAIICIAAFHHLSCNESRINALNEMKRLLKKQGGLILLSVWSFNQPKKTRVTFNTYGHNFVKWNHNHIRYYYIFQIDEIKNLFDKCELKIVNHKYDCGNEIFILQTK